MNHSILPVTIMTAPVLYDVDESYEAACTILYSCHPKAGLRSNDWVVRRCGFQRRFVDTVPFLLSLLGYSLEDLNRLNPIGITASKVGVHSAMKGCRTRNVDIALTSFTGKRCGGPTRSRYRLSGKLLGSTTAFTAELLLQLGQRNARKVKIGSLNGPAYATQRDIICIVGERPSQMVSKSLKPVSRTAFPSARSCLQDIFSDSGTGCSRSSVPMIPKATKNLTSSTSFSYSHVQSFSRRRSMRRSSKSSAEVVVRPIVCSAGAVPAPR